MIVKVRSADKMLNEVKEGMHVILISPLNNRMFYLYQSDIYHGSFKIEISIATKTTEDSFFYSDLTCRGIFSEWLDLKCTRLRIYQTEQEARQCVELWKTLLFKEEV